MELFWQFRFRRADILQTTNELKEELEHLNRKGALPPVFTGRRTAESLPTLMNINSSSNGLSWTATVPHFCLFVCFFLLLLLFCCCCCCSELLLLLFFFLCFPQKYTSCITSTETSLKKKSFFMSLSVSRTWSAVRTHTPRLLPFLAISCHNWLVC